MSESCREFLNPWVLVVRAQCRPYGLRPFWWKERQRPCYMIEHRPVMIFYLMWTMELQAESTTGSNQTQLFVGHQNGGTSASTPHFDRGPREGANKCSFGIGGDVRTLCKQGQLKQALQILNLRDQQGIKTDLDTYICLLQGCLNVKAMAEGKRVHAHIIQSGSKTHVFLENTLINMYTACGGVLEARQVFDKMPVRNMVSWNAMIAGYAKNGHAEEALRLFQKMEWNGMKPSKFTFLSILKACASLGALEQGKQLHSLILKSGCQSDVFVGSTLIDMYAKCGSIEHAYQVFEKMPERNVVAWNVMIAGYAQHGHGEEAVRLFQKMEMDGMKPNKVTFLGILKACASLGALELGKQIHLRIIESGLESDIFIGSTLVDMYAKCGSVEYACQLFDKMPKRNVVSWTAMIAGYAQHGHGQKALKSFWQMQREGVKPNKVTFTSVLNACASLAALEQGRQIHACIVENRLEADVFVASTLVDMYAKCGSIEEAHRVFDKMPERDVVSWTAMITGYAQHEHDEMAINFFWQMQKEGVNPNKVTFLSVLKACASLGALEQGEQMHAYIIKSGLESDMFVGNSLVDMYAKCRNIRRAREVFNNITERDVISWTSMISGYAQHGCAKEALNLFWQMEQEAVKPNYVTFLSVLNACASLAVLEQGKRIHAHINEIGFESVLGVANALIDMYAKCGSLELARQVFERMPQRDVVSWNAMVVGYAQHGHGKDALQLVERMQREGMRLDHITFVGVLSACSHAGLVDEGFHHFESIRRDHGIIPTVEHYACMVDLLGRAGRLKDAADLIKKMPVKPSIEVWMALLGACRIHGNVELAICAAKSTLELEPQIAAPYVLLSNVYAACSRWDDKAKVVKLMKDRCISKEPGCSHIEVNNELHFFIADDTSHPQLKAIYAELKRLSGQMEEAGYVADTRFVLHNVDEEQKKTSLWYHSEKLAIAFGLITMPYGAPIHIIKNLRVCGDCHTAIKCISKVVGREIVVRDANRFHHFKNGICSCSDYW